MTSEEKLWLEKQNAGFDEFYENLMPVLVDFVEKLGIDPAAEVLRHAVQYAPVVGQALEQMAVVNDHDRSWLLTRTGYFVGEYFTQKYDGHWFVNEIPNSRYFGRYVVGQFAQLNNAALMLDPFQVAQAYVDTAIPRQLEPLLASIDSELAGI